MASESHPSELEALHQFVAEQLANGGDTLSPEECLDLWRAEHPSDAELEESASAIERALEQAERGEGKSIAEFDRDFRRRHNMSQDA